MHLVWAILRWHVIVILLLLQGVFLFLCFSTMLCLTKIVFFGAECDQKYCINCLIGKFLQKKGLNK